MKIYQATQATMTPDDVDVVLSVIKEYTANNDGIGDFISAMDEAACAARNHLRTLVIIEVELAP